MKHKLLIITLVILGLAGCKSSKQNPDDIRNQIVEYKKQVVSLNSKIHDLELQLNNDTTASDNLLLVEIDTIESKHYEHYITVSANVDAEEHAMISPQMNGQIIKIYVSEGQRVKKGQVLAKLNDDVLQKNLAQLRTSLLLADTMYQKQKMLFDQNVISEVQYLQAKNQKEALEKNIEVIKTQIQQTQITAPFSGIIDKIDIKEGEIATPGRPIIQIVNLNSMIAKANISEKYLPDLKIGDLVNISFSTYPDIKINTKIFQMGNVIDPVNRTFWLKVKFNNINEKIKPNMLSTLKLKDYEADNVLYVPTNIMSKDINGWFLFTAKFENNQVIAKKTYIEIGISDVDYTTIKSGLTDGDFVITKGYNQISDGQIIKIN